MCQHRVIMKGDFIMENLTLEQRAHDLAILLCQQKLSEKHVLCDHSDVFDFVKTYEHYYSYALDSFEQIK